MKTGRRKQQRRIRPRPSPEAIAAAVIADLIKQTGRIHIDGVFRIRALRGRLADGRERGPQLPARLLQQQLPFVHVTSVQEQDSELQIALGPFERVLGALGRFAREPHQDGLAAPNQLLVHRPQVHHQALVDAAEQDHDQ